MIAMNGYLDCESTALPPTMLGNRADPAGCGKAKTSELETDSFGVRRTEGLAPRSRNASQLVQNIEMMRIRSR